MSENGEIQRSVLPIPDRPHVGLVTYGGGYAKGGTVSLDYDGDKVREGSVGATQPFIFSADEGVDIGCEKGSAVAPDCDVHSSTFTDEITWVELKVGDDDHSYLLDPENHPSVPMGRQ